MTVRTCYVDFDTRSIADLVAPSEADGRWLVTRINVPREHRGSGVGSRLLREITSDADREGATLALEPQASDGLGYFELVRWYGRHGFVMDPRGYMVRGPAER